jgi:hypothetical protein
MPRSRRLIGCAVTLAVAVALGAPRAAATWLSSPSLGCWPAGPSATPVCTTWSGSGPAAPRPSPPWCPCSCPSRCCRPPYVPAELLPGWVRAAAAVNPYRHEVDAVRAAMAGTLDAGQLTAAMTAVAAAVALTQLAAARRFASLVRHD